MMQMQWLESDVLDIAVNTEPLEDAPTMVCPFCSHDIPELWQRLFTHSDEVGRDLATNAYTSDVHSVIPSKRDPSYPQAQRIVGVMVEWLRCQNADCRQIVVRVVRLEMTRKSPNLKKEVDSVDSWLAVPKVKAPPILDPLVTKKYARDYIEAARILDDSPRMSSVLSRRILADLLNEYAHANQYGLAARIDLFIADTNHPSRLRENLHYLREMGDFSAHTQTDSEHRIIDVTPEEAAWTIKVIADLFDYFIVAPAKDAKLRKAFDAKLAAANRKPIAKLSDAPPKEEP